MKLKLTDNLFLKVLSILLAVVLWLVVLNISDAKGTKPFQVEVSLINTEVITNNGKVFRVEDGTNLVKVTVRARQSVLRDLERTDFILTADMQKDLKYDRLVGITVECKNKSINVDEDVTLNRSNVEVSIEDSATEQFQVYVKQVGTQNTGLVVGSMVPEQSIIKITGPVSIVERIKSVEAQVDVTGLTSTSVRTCELKLYDSAGQSIDTTYLNFVGKSDGINVTVSMLNTKAVPLKFSYTGTPAENYVVKSISYKPEVVEIAGSAGVLSGISKLEIPPEAVDVEGIDEELQMVVDLTQYLPSGVILKEENEASVLVIVEVEYVEPEEEEEPSNPPDSSNDHNSKPSNPAEEDTKEDTTENNGEDNTGTESSKDPESPDPGTGEGTSKGGTST